MATVPESGTSELVSAEESQRRLMEASADYMHHRITLEELRHIEQEYTPDYGAAMLALAKGQAASDKQVREEKRSHLVTLRH